jgi:hypothetical protein
MHRRGINQCSIAPLVVFHQIDLQLRAILGKTGNQIGLLRRTATQVHGHAALPIGIASILMQMAGEDRRHLIFVDHVAKALLLCLGTLVFQRLMHIDDDGITRSTGQSEVRFEPVQCIIDFKRRRIQWMSNASRISISPLIISSTWACAPCCFLKSAILAS